MNPSDGAIIPVLFLVTLLVFLVIGVWQYLRARKAKREHRHTTLGDRPTPRKPSPSPERESRGDRFG